MRQNEAHIVYASDEKFAEILGVSMVSLFENSRDMDGIQIYVLDSGLMDESRGRLVSICNAYGRAMPQFISARDICGILGHSVNADRGSLSQYARLFVSSDLPEELDRVLYLDCDIILRESISSLWNLSFPGKTIAALNDAFSRSYRRNIDLAPEDIMFNSGVMLIDLKRWREKNIEQQLLDFISKKHGIVQQGDQGALNAVLSHDMYCFDPRFNAVTLFYDFTYREIEIYRKPPNFYDRETVAAAAADPALVHFTSSFLSTRPWITGCEHPYRDEWLHYKALSPWKDAPLWPENRSRSKRLTAGVVNHLPRGFGIRLVSIPQAYLRPLYYSIKSGRK